MQNYNPLAPFFKGDMGVVPFFKGDFVKPPLVNKGGGVKSPLIKGESGGCLFPFKFFHPILNPFYHSTYIFSDIPLIKSYYR